MRETVCGRCTALVPGAGCRTSVLSMHICINTVQLPHLPPATLNTHFIIHACHSRLAQFLSARLPCPAFVSPCVRCSPVYGGALFSLFFSMSTRVCVARDAE